MTPRLIKTDIWTGLCCSRLMKINDRVQSRCNFISFVCLCMSVSQTEVTDSRSSSTLSLARIRPGTITNGTSKHSTSSCSSGAQSSSSGHKAQRSASTYHRQRRHSDFCKAKYRDWWLLFVSIHLETLKLHKFSSLRTLCSVRWSSCSRINTPQTKSQRRSWRGRA